MLAVVVAEAAELAESLVPNLVEVAMVDLAVEMDNQVVLGLLEAYQALHAMLLPEEVPLVPPLAEAEQQHQFR